MTDYVGQIARAIARTRAEFALWDVRQIIVSPQTWDHIAADMPKSALIKHAHQVADMAGLPVTALEILGVSVVASKHHGPHFTIVRAQTFEFRA